MEPLPKGANFIRAKFLWEIGLHIAGDPAEPYYGNRDVCITVGSGSGERYQPWLRMSSGSPILAHAVARGELEAAIVNPSALLAQAVRGRGLFKEALPLCIVANYPSWDRFVFAAHPRLGIKSLADVKAKRIPLRLSTREDPTHSTRCLIDQALALFSDGFDERCERQAVPKPHLVFKRKKPLDIGRRVQLTRHEHTYGAAMHADASDVDYL